MDRIPQHRNGQCEKFTEHRVSSFDFIIMFVFEHGYTVGLIPIGDAALDLALYVPVLYTVYCTVRYILEFYCRNGSCE
jgi:hypothetical protein